MENTFNKDITFLQKHTDAFVLSDSAGVAQIVVVPAYQGRVMTSTTGDGDSFGWINYELIASGNLQPHVNAFGGEERFWMGPEGGQFAIFFKKGDAFGLEDWQTPAVIDTETYDIVSQGKTYASFRKTTQLTNMSDTKLDVQIDRTIKMLDKPQVQEVIGISVPKSVKMVAFESENKLTNIGTNTWTKETGMLSVWILNMLKHSSETTVIIPFKSGPESTLGPKVNDTYFGKVPAERLIVQDDVLFFNCDGQYRSKIGVSPKRAKNILGSYDAIEGVLTLVHYNLPEGVTDYVNSMWEYQQDPFSGDTVNSYNDGPPEPGKKPLGPFYEIETSSPAANLQPGQDITHYQRTIHLKGPKEDLNQIAIEALGVSLDEIPFAE